MGKLALVCAILTSIAFASSAPGEEPIGLKVLYAGHLKSDRTKDFQAFLTSQFTEVGLADYLTLTEAETKKYDVIVLDWPEMRPPRVETESTRSFVVPRLGPSYFLVAPESLVRTSKVNGETRREPDPENPVTASVELCPARVRSGDKLDVVVRVKIAPAFHIYAFGSSKGPGVPTTLRLTLPKGFEDSTDWACPGPIRDPDGQMAYEGTIEFRRQIRVGTEVAPGRIDVRCEVQYQACNRFSCQLPAKLTLQARGEVSQRQDVIQPPNDSPRRTRQVEIIERYGPSVVAIFTKGKDNTLGSGSGSVIHRDGYILTNDHVVVDHPGVVLHPDFPPLPFRTIGRLKEKDLALIKVDVPKALVTVPLGRSHDLLAGEPILIGGNPSGRGIVFSAGIVSSPKVMIGVSAFAMTFYPNDSRDRFIQFDAASNPGNSGGPMINAEGRQVGVVVGKIFEEQAINYAIPIDRAHQSFHDLILPEERGDFWTGIELELAANTVRRVAPKSPAEQAGLRAGDKITALGGSPVASAVEYLVSLVGRKQGERIGLKYTRTGVPAEASISLVPFPMKPGLSSAARKPGLRYRLCRGRFTKCPDFDKMKIVSQGTVLAPRLISGFPGHPWSSSVTGRR
jgi:S1-C subfamily serine protease